MSLLRLALASALTAIALTGCVPDTGAVLLHLDQRSGGTYAPFSYSSSQAAAGTTPDGVMHLTATSSQGVLTIVLGAPPLVEGSTIELPADAMQFAINDAVWTSTAGGSALVLSLDRVILRFFAVPMEARSGPAVGAFVFNGGGTFTFR